MTDFKTNYGGKIERDMDWQDGMNTFRTWVSRELSEIHLSIEQITKQLKEKS